MITKAAIRRIRSLALKKHRLQTGSFVAEGPKVVEELSRRATPLELYYGDDADRASLLQHPQGVLAVFPAGMFAGMKPSSTLRLMLDGVQDPGNVGTIIRIADWFGIDHVICSPNTADALSPKVVQAAMGSLARVKVDYADLAGVIDALPEGFPVYGTFLDGNNMYKEELAREAIIVMGNEGNGISEAVRRRVNRRLLIPSFPEGRATAESLNVAVATAIVCAEFRRI